MGIVITKKSVGIDPYLSLISTNSLVLQKVSAAISPRPNAIKGPGRKGEIFLDNLQMKKVAMAMIEANGLNSCEKSKIFSVLYKVSVNLGHVVGRFTILFEYPHSLSYHEMTFRNLGLI